MKIDIEEITSVRKSLTVEIPEEVINAEFKNLYAEISKKATLPGFRKGKVPLSLIEKKYAAEIEEDVVRKLVPDYYKKAIKEAGLSPVTAPAFEKIEVKRNASLRFKAVVEIMPKMPPLNYKGIAIPRKKVTVNDADVEMGLKELQEAQGQLDVYPDEHEILTSDYAIIDYSVTSEGNSIDQGSNALWQVGGKSSLPELDTALMGKKQKDRVEVDIPFSEEHQNKKLAGKTVRFNVEIKAVKRKVIPTLDDEFAKDMGLSSLITLKEKVQLSLTEALQSQQERSQKELLIKKLIEQHPLAELPSSMVESELHATLDRLHQTLPEGADMEALHQQYEPIAKQRVHGTLIMDAIASAEGIEVSSEETEQEVERIAKATKQSSQKVYQILHQRESAMEGLQSRIMLEKALDRVYTLAQFQDQSENQGETH